MHGGVGGAGVNVYARVSFWWRVGLVAAGLVGLWLGAARLTFYTIQSNLIVVGYYLTVLYWMRRRRTTDPAAPRLRGAVTFWILITGLVAHIVLNHGANPLPGLVHGDQETLLSNRSVFLLHYVVPGMVLVDWVAFGPRRVSRWRDLPVWLLYPLGYSLASIVRAVAFPAATDRYPYSFLDPTGHGYGWVTLQLVILGLELSVLGAAIIALDRLPGRRAAQPAAVPAA
jgi:hypothetical protein